MSQPIELRSQQWVQLTGPGYTVEATQFSNKGPLFIIKDSAGKEIGRARFCLDGKCWKLDHETPQ